jgi:hypothetical protein
MTIKQMARMGGRARMAALTDEQRQSLARLAGSTRMAALTPEQRKAATQAARDARSKKCKTVSAPDTLS